MDAVDLARDLGRELRPDAPLDRGYLGVWIDVSGVQLERVLKLSDLERLAGALGSAGYALTSAWPIPDADAPNPERAFVARMLDETRKWRLPGSSESVRLAECDPGSIRVTTNPSSPESSGPVPTDPLSALNGAQSALVRVLQEKDESVAMMYVGAIRARLATDNPDHLAQASHSVRELIDNLPKYFDIPLNRIERLGDRVNALATKWKKETRVKNKSTEPVSERFTKKLEQFFEWNEQSFPKRREIARTTIRAAGCLWPATARLDRDPTSFGVDGYQRLFCFLHASRKLLSRTI